MKNFSFLLITLLLLVLGCEQSSKETQDNELNSPGPVTDSDKSRYNLNSVDETTYGTIDSLGQDSLRTDSLNRP